jgi:hypothetical protein
MHNLPQLEHLPQTPPFSRHKPGKESHYPRITVRYIVTRSDTLPQTLDCGKTTLPQISIVANPKTQLFQLFQLFRDSS